MKQASKHKKNIFKPFTFFFVVVSSIAAMLIIDFKTEKETKKKDHERITNARNGIDRNYMLECLHTK